MRRLLTALVFACLSAVLFVPHYSAQDSSEQRSLKETVIDDIELTGATSAVSLDEVKSMSEVGVVATITEGGCAYAVGFAGDLAFKTRVWEGVSQSFGVYAGRLAFSKPKQGSIGDQLFIVDLRTNQQQSLFPDGSVLRAEWQPMGSSLAAVVRRGPDVSLLLYSLGNGRAETLRQQSIQPGFLRWSKKGDTLYFIEGEDSQQERYLVQRTFSTSSETRTRVEESEIQFLSAKSDLNDRMAVQRNSDGSADLNLQSGERGSRVVKNAVPISRVEGGLLLQFSDSHGTHLAMWNSKSGKLVLISESSATRTPPTPTAETGLPGRSFAAALSSPLSRPQAQSRKSSEDSLWQFIDQTPLVNKSSNQAMLAQPHSSARPSGLWLVRHHWRTYEES